MCNDNGTYSNKIRRLQVCSFSSMQNTRRHEMNTRLYIKIRNDKKKQVMSTYFIAIDTTQRNNKCFFFFMVITHFWNWTTEEERRKWRVGEKNAYGNWDCFFTLSCMSKLLNFFAGTRSNIKKMSKNNNGITTFFPCSTGTPNLLLYTYTSVFSSSLSQVVIHNGSLSMNAKFKQIVIHFEPCAYSSNSFFIPAKKRRWSDLLYSTAVFTIHHYAENVPRLILHLSHEFGKILLKYRWIYWVKIYFEYVVCFEQVLCE